MSVPFIDLKRDLVEHRAEYLACVERVFDSGVLSLGPEVEAFESAFATYCGVPYAVGVSGGTMALYAAFLALDIGAGDEVIIPANSFIATAEAVVMTGAKPVFCDVHPETALLDLSTCDRLVTTATKAIVPVHLYGQLVDMDAVVAWARARHLFVVEDCAQAHGAERAGRRAGSFGDIGCFSFYPTKNLGAIGEGGAVVTNDATLAQRLKAIRLHGIMKEKYRHDVFGSNLKMEALQGAFLQCRLARLEGANVRRRAIADSYRERLASLPCALSANVGSAHVYHLFVIQTDRRDELQTFLKERGIATAIHYPWPIHLQPSMQRFGGKPGDCVQAERMASRILSLPLFPEMREEEIEEVCAGVTAFYS